MHTGGENIIILQVGVRSEITFTLRDRQLAVCLSSMYTVYFLIHSPDTRTFTGVRPALQTDRYLESRCINTWSRRYSVCGRCGSWWSERRLAVWRNRCTDNCNSASYQNRLDHFGRALKDNEPLTSSYSSKSHVTWCERLYFRWWHRCTKRGKHTLMLPVLHCWSLPLFFQFGRFSAIF